MNSSTLHGLCNRARFFFARCTIRAYRELSNVSQTSFDLLCVGFSSKMTTLIKLSCMPYCERIDSTYNLSDAIIMAEAEETNHCNSRDRHPRSGRSERSTTSMISFFCLCHNDGDRK